MNGTLAQCSGALDVRDIKSTIEHEKAEECDALPVCNLQRGL